MSQVEFYDGATLKATDSTSLYTYRWSVTSADAGSHTWTAKAYDTNNNFASSTAVSLGEWSS